MYCVFIYLLKKKKKTQHRVAHTGDVEGKLKIFNLPRETLKHMPLFSVTTK